MPKFIFLVLLIVTSFLFFLDPNHVLAAETCEGTVTDESGNPLADVKIELYTGIFAPTITPTSTQSNGHYTFMVTGFGGGSLAINKAVFTQEGYQVQIFDYLRTHEGQGCPGNVTLNSLSEGSSRGYFCHQGVCSFATSGVTFSDEAACELDCGKWVLDTTRGSCRPQLAGDTGGVFYSKRECESKTPTNVDQKYKYNINSNTCIPDPAGETLEECLKKIRPSFTPLKGPLALGAGQSCDDGVVTAIGCIHTEPGLFLKDLLTFVISIAGSIAFILMLFGAFQMITSAGNAETLKGGQELFTNAIIGLLFIAFSVLLMQIIGVDILAIPGLKR